MKAELMRLGAQFSLFCAGQCGLLLSATDEVGLLDNGPTGYFDDTIVQTGMEKAALLDTYLSVVQNGINDTDAAEIIVLLLENEVNVDYFSHIVAIQKFLLQRYSK